MLYTAAGQDDQILQDDPCLVKSRVVGDVQYCDRYWECTTGDPELYDCPNGLVWVEIKKMSCVKKNLGFKKISWIS